MEPSCGNCGKSGHNFHQCKMPIISLGIVAFRKTEVDGELQFLMIRRKDTLGFMDFMRGKYSIYNKEYLLNLLNEMTIHEKSGLLSNGFTELWGKLWCNQSGQYIQEERSSRDKFETLISGVMTHDGDNYTLASLIEESNSCSQWEEAEWGFPKGRRNHNEKDIDCALREFEEETGYRGNATIENLQPFEEIFMGSNFKSYKHKYYLMKVDSDICRPFDETEVSKIEWKTYDECLASIRSYNLEKKRVIEDIYKCLTNYILTI
jgi:8-oxo-dGTP pyrophosphatase MutT (NUDIX family)